MNLKITVYSLTHFTHKSLNSLVTDKWENYSYTHFRNEVWDSFSLSLKVILPLFPRKNVKNVQEWGILAPFDLHSFQVIYYITKKASLYPKRNKGKWPSPLLLPLFSLRRFWLICNPMDLICQGPQYMRFPRHEYWSG